MSLILNIDTSTEIAHVSFAEEDRIIEYKQNENQKDHAGFLQKAIREMVNSTGISLSHLDAIAVTSGPGSYTGLRVGFSSAKGLCYALNKPLITISTLEVLAESAKLLYPDLPSDILFCPMIDARRMEVFTAVYNSTLDIVLPATALILEAESFADIAETKQILFFGSGGDKWQKIATHKNMQFRSVNIQPKAMAILTKILYFVKKFNVLSYCEPSYIKDFQSFTK